MSDDQKRKRDPAAPRPDDPNRTTREIVPPVSHITLRDHFAGQAMHAECVTAGALPGPARALGEAAGRAGQTIEERIAFNAYRMADAMLKEREEER